ncbi:MAG TPA: DUF202 domain-containing protein [Humibacillus xanthopallidus]|nr:DUF202 domain-containing protein [Humibacillus xanthopallidus]
MSQPSGPGLAEERTGFAWRRTAVSVAVGALLCLKILPPLLGPAGWALAVLGFCWSADLARIGRRRHIEARASTGRGASVPLGGGGNVVRTAAVTCAVGVTATVAAVVIAMRGGGV